MLKYNTHLKPTARQLRKHWTDSESALGARLRNQQRLGIQGSRQKPIGEHSVDFVAPRATLVVDVDGAQPLAGDPALQARRRAGYLVSLGLQVWRCTSRDVLEDSDAVAEAIDRTGADQLNAQIPSGPPLIKGG